MVVGQAPLARVLDTGLFDFAKAEQAPGWLKELRGEHVPETEEFGIRSFVYRARRPFHPRRFYDYLREGEWNNGTLLRSKGFFWLASRPEWVGSWSQAGGIMHHGCTGRWWASLPDHQWPEEYRSDILANWREPFGDCLQELVFIGQNLDAERVCRELDACLLTEQELVQGPSLWRTYEDDLPTWFEEEGWGSETALSA